MSDEKTLIRYVTIPQDILVPAGIGFAQRKGTDVKDGGVLSCEEFLRRLVFGRLKRDTAAEMELEGTLLSRLSGIPGGSKVELPELAWAAVCEALPKELAGQNIELYLALRPFFLAFISAPSEPPEGWSKAA